MSRVFLDMAVSLDGFICGPDGGDGGLHDWYFAADAAEDIKAELLARTGAMILGARAFGTAPDGFDTPYEVPHFILTHRPRPSVTRGGVTRGGASFHFVTEGLESALTLAREAAGPRDVCVAGGADVARQCLRAGVLDELHLHVAPVLLGGGLPLFGPGDPPRRLHHVRTVQSAHATHLTYTLTADSCKET